MRITRTEATFTPAEAAEITGVGVALQRDWRRRGLLPAKQDNKRTMFRPIDLTDMMAMQAFSEAGLSVLELKTVAGMSALPTLGFIDQLSDLSIQAGRAVPPMVVGEGTDDRFIVKIGDAIGRVRSLDAIDRHLEQHPDSHPVIVIYDCLAAARRIVRMAKRPVVSVEVTE